MKKEKGKNKNSPIAESNRAEDKVKMILRTGDSSICEAMANEAFHRKRKEEMKNKRTSNKATEVIEAYERSLSRACREALLEGISQIGCRPGAGEKSYVLDVTVNNQMGAMNAITYFDAIERSHGITCDFMTISFNHNHKKADGKKTHAQKIFRKHDLSFWILEKSNVFSVSVSPGVGEDGYVFTVEDDCLDRVNTVLTCLEEINRDHSLHCDLVILKGEMR